MRMTEAAAHTRSWQVLLLSGASGTGKTSVSYRLARHFDIALTEVDDLYIVLECLTTPEQQPVLHYWRTHPDAGKLSPEQIVEHHITVSKVLTPALAAVVANHLETNTPLVLEGDFILPILAAQPTFGEIGADGMVRAVFLYEEDEAQILNNLLQREPEHGPQHKRARLSWLYGQWLKQEAKHYGLLVVPARPWDTVLERILDAL